MEKFLAEIQGRAFRMAQLATGNRDEALDIVQEAMTKLVQHYSSHDKESWRPLFFSILESRILDWHRRQSVRNRFRVWLDRDDEESEESILDRLATSHELSPELIVQDTQFMEALERALRALPLRQQQVFLLRLWEGLDISETARIMACSESSVKTHYARALEKLREALQEHHV